MTFSWLTESDAAVTHSTIPNEEYEEAFTKSLPLNPEQP
jgi:hypothetical protein